MLNFHAGTLSSEISVLKPVHLMSRWRLPTQAFIYYDFADCYQSIGFIAPSSLNNSRCDKLLWPWLVEAFYSHHRSGFSFNWEALNSNGADDFIRYITEHSQPQLCETLETHEPAEIGHTSNWVESISTGIIFKTSTWCPLECIKCLLFLRSQSICLFIT